MASHNDVTALEEVQRYYRKIKDATQPVIARIIPENETKDAKKQADCETAMKLFNNDVDGDQDGWIDVENNEENHRLATGTGPIQLASSILHQKISEVGTTAAEKASQVPAVVRLHVEDHVERLVEGVGRITVSDVVEGVVKRHPLLDRLRKAFFRGRDSKSLAQAVSSPLAESPPSQHELAQENDTRSCRGDDEMEDVPLEEDDTKETEAWEEFK